MSYTNRHPFVSVIVPIFNGEHELPGMLSALTEQDYPADRYEILCVDNNSTDRTAEIIWQWSSKNVKYLGCKRQGSHASRNVGLLHAKGEIIAFTDADCLPTPGWLSAGVAQLLNHNLSLVAGAVQMPVKASDSAWARLDASFYLDQESSIQAGWAATANLFLRRSVVDQIGPLNERLISWGDIEFVRRATAAGLALGYGQKAVVIHPPRSRAMQILKRSRRSGIGHAQIMLERSPAYLHSWRKFLPRPLSQSLFQERLGHLHLNFWQKFQLRVMRYFFVEWVHIISYAWGYWILRCSRSYEKLSAISRSENQTRL